MIRKVTLITITTLSFILLATAFGMAMGETIIRGSILGALFINALALVVIGMLADLAFSLFVK